MNTSSQMSWRPQPRLGSSKVLGLPALAGLSRWWRRPCAVESLFANCELAEWVTCVRPHFDDRGHLYTYTQAHVSRPARTVEFSRYSTRPAETDARSAGRAERRNPIVPDRERVPDGWPPRT